MPTATTSVEKIQLNTGQQRAFDMYRRGYNIVLTGNSGTGKSACTEAICKDAYQRDTYVLKTGSTGISVVNIHGDATFHSAFGLGIGVDYRSKTEIAKQANNIIGRSSSDKSGVAKRLNEARGRKALIVVDEISMLDALTLWMGTQIANNFIKSCQWLLVGDPMQLPNISGDWFWKDVKVNKTFNVLRDNDFKVVHLNEVMRQKGDNDFIEALNTVRTGSMPRLVANRYKEEVPGDSALHIHYNNESVMLRNKEVAERLKSQGNDSHIFEGSVAGASREAKWVKDYLPIEVDMEVVLNQRFMLRRNGEYGVVNSRGKRKGSEEKKIFVSNGSVGIVVDFVEVRSEDTGEVVDTGILLKLDSGDEIIVEPVDMEGPSDATGRPLGILHQLPGHPSESISGHKTQSLTIKTPIVIHAWQVKGGQRNAITTPAWIYVTTSRVTSQDLVYYDNSEGVPGVIRLRDSICCSEEAKQWLESSTTS